MTEPAALRPDAQAVQSAKEKLAQRDNLIRAGGIKEGRALERKDAALEQAKLLAAHQGELQGAKNAHADELNRAAARERAIGFHRAAWMFGITGAAAGAIGAAALIAWIVAPLNAQTQGSVEAGVMIERAAREHGAERVLTEPEGQ